MTYGQVGAVCPRCGSAANVHSIQELADLARLQLSRLGQTPGTAPPDPPAQQGQVPGWAAEPVAHGPGQGQPGQPGPTFRPGRGADWSSRDSASSGNALDDIAADAAGAVMGAAAKFIGRRIANRVQSTMTDKVMPTLANQAQAKLRNQIAIADRHPELRACLTDKVVFLEGGSQVEPMPDLSGSLSVEDADALVDRLRNA